MHAVHIVGQHLPHAVQYGFLHLYRRGNIIIGQGIISVVAVFGKPAIPLAVIADRIADIPADTVRIDPGVKLQPPLVRGFYRISQWVKARLQQGLDRFRRLKNLGGIIGVAVGAHMEKHSVQPIGGAVFHHAVDRRAGLCRGFALQKSLHFVKRNPGSPQLAVERGLRRGRGGGCSGCSGRSGRRHGRIRTGSFCPGRAAGGGGCRPAARSRRPRRRL